MCSFEFLDSLLTLHVSSMMAPGLADIAIHYGITTPTVLNMTLSIFLLAYATGPLILSPLTEIVGRKWVRIFLIIYVYSH